MNALQDVTSSNRHCKAVRAVLIAAPASGQGKTTVTAALAWQARQRGERVRVFKTGPDFLDPMIHARASGHACYQLDLFMGGLAHCRQLLAQAATEADLILVEGVMGLFDGDPSSADLARAFGLPVLAVIDASAMAQTFAAVAHGLTHYQSTLSVTAVVANRVANAGHAQMVLAALPANTHAGWLPRAAEISLPERHLGLLPASELTDLDARLAAAAHALNLDADHWPRVEFQITPTARSATPLAGRRIAIARDAAFCFIYPANLDVLRELGAECVFFSPLQDAALPPCDALWLPGGYPELHAQAIANNSSLRTALQAHQAAGKPILAECGGMMSLFRSMTLLDGSTVAGVAVLLGHCRMQPQLAALGLQSVTLPEGELRGHSFHFSTCSTPMAPLAQANNPNGGSTREMVYRYGATTASYMHFYFPSNPDAVAALFAGVSGARS